tara:strand:- start:1488 stop:3785 length:2298 start_codon:yes stop_codon:yes gene_type:complete
LKRFLFILIIVNFAFISVYTQDVKSIETTNNSDVIANIDFYGNKIVVNEKIQQYLVSKIGEKYDSEKIKKDIKSLYDTGFFYKIDILTTKTKNGIDILFRLEENPILADFRIKGNDKITTDDLMQALNLEEGKIISRKDLEVSRSIVESFYRFKGFNKVVVTDNIVPIGESKIQYEIRVVEGRRGYVKGIKFIGIDSEYAPELIKRLETQEKWFFSPITGRGRLSTGLVELDENNIRQFLLEKGYIDAKTDQSKIEYIEEKDGYKVIFKARQGDRYKAGKISLQGDLIEEEEVLLKKIKLDDSEYFSTKILNEDIEALNKVYGNKSYAFVNVNPNIKRDNEQRLVHVEYEIEKGEKYKINLINISGNTRTRDKVIRREVQVNEDDDYSYSAIKASKSRINRNGYFEKVEITEKPATDKQNYLDLNIEVEEKSTGYFAISGGYSSAETIMFGANIQENNLWGYGKQLGASATVGGLSKNFYVNYNDPYFFDTKYQFGLVAFKKLFDYVDYDRDSWGGRVKFGKSLNYFTFANLAYRYENITIDDLKLNANEIFQKGTDKISSINLGLLYDTRDNFVDTSRGMTTGANVEESNEVLGANLEFTKYTADFAKYWSIKKHHTIAYSIEGAFIDFRNMGSKIVVSERFYLGGPDNLRGYKYARVSPRRFLSNGNFVRIGGNKYVYSSLEYLYPLAIETGLKGILFVDVGETYDEKKNIDYNPYDMRKDAGFGFRWLSPMGPLKLDFGFPLGKRRSGESKYEVQFSIGSLF